MVIERIDYYDEELGHRWASVDVRLVLKLFRCIFGGTCMCRKGAELIWLEELVKEYGGDDYQEVY